MKISEKICHNLDGIQHCLYSQNRFVKPLIGLLQLIVYVPKTLFLILENLFLNYLILNLKSIPWNIVSGVDDL